MIERLGTEKMLSDTTIRRDGNYSIPRRMVLNFRKRAASRFRPQLNERIRKTLGDIQFTVFSNNCLGGVFYHDAGRQFTSPLINTAMDGDRPQGHGRRSGEGV